MSLELWREITAEYNGRIIKGSFKFIDGKVDVRTQHEARQVNWAVVLPSRWRRLCSANWRAKEGLKVRDYG